MQQYLQQNINWISGLFTIVFSGITVLIAVLAFQRAKETILQPIRTEVIKKQIALLTDLLERLRGATGTDLLENLDYQGIIDLNVASQLYNYGFITNRKESDSLEKIKCSMILTNGAEELAIESIDVFENEEQDKKTEIDRRKMKYDLAKDGKVSIGIIHLTQKYLNFISSLNTLLEDPFLPEAIEEPLRNFIKNVNINLSLHLKEVLEKFILDIFSKSGADKKYPIKFSTAGLFNEFNHRRIDNAEDYKKLISKIRTYLKIDSMP